jgi:hypothetical protein
LPEHFNFNSFLISKVPEESVLFQMFSSGPGRSSAMLLVTQDILSCYNPSHGQSEYTTCVRTQTVLCDAFRWLPWFRVRYRRSPSVRHSVYCRKLLGLRPPSASRRYCNTTMCDRYTAAHIPILSISFSTSFVECNGLQSPQ